MQHPFYQRSSVASASTSQPRYHPPSVAPAGYHARRHPRPRSVLLETLPEREAEEGHGSEHITSGGEQSSRMIRPTSMYGLQSYSHDGSSSHLRASTTPSHPLLSRPQNRRHSSFPIRSSPLAGPSVALTQDGMLTNITAVPRPRSLLSVSESAYNSPVPSANPSLENLTINVTTANTHKSGSTPPPTPPLPAKQTPTRKLSLGFKKLTALPSLPKRISANVPVASDNSKANAKGKAKETDALAAAEAAAPMPNIPRVPVWASPGYTSTRTGSRAPLPYRPHSSIHLHPSSAATLNRRSSLAGPSPSEPKRTSHRRSLAVSAAHASLAIPGDQTPEAPREEEEFRPDPRLARRPSTSRAPELNWLTTAEPPKFSRQSLKAEGVIMPVSAKEMRRRSTSGVSMTGSVRSLSSTRTSARGAVHAYGFGTTSFEGAQSARELATPLASPALSTLSIPEDDTDADTDPVSPPFPPFFLSSKNTSKSSMLSSSSAGTASADESDVLETPSLSRTSSVTDHDDEEGGVPRTPPGTIAGAGSVGVVSDGTKDLHISAAAAKQAGKDDVVVAGGVKVEVVTVRATTGKGHLKEESSGVKSAVGEEGKVQRKGTLKKVLGRVFGRRSGSVSSMKA